MTDEVRLMCLGLLRVAELRLKNAAELFDQDDDQAAGAQLLAAGADIATILIMDKAK